MAVTSRKTPATSDVTRVRRGQIQQMRTTQAKPAQSLRSAVERRKNAGK
ncbi:MULTISPECIES: hypothetical protein [Gordonia]|nr:MULTISPECIES: hypothetical protein [Gordonia]